MKILIYVDRDTGEIWYHVFEGEGEPVIIKPRKKEDEKENNEELKH